MHDIEISATIVAQIMHDDFLDEVPGWIRVFLVALFCAINVIIVGFVRTRWAVLNGVIYFAVYHLLVTTASLTMVYAFTSNYFLHFDSLQPLLVITSLLAMSTSNFKSSSLIRK